MMLAASASPALARYRASTSNRPIALVESSATAGTARATSTALSRTRLRGLAVPAPAAPETVDVVDVAVASLAAVDVCETVRCRSSRSPGASVVGVAGLSVRLDGSGPSASSSWKLCMLDVVPPPIWCAPRASRLRRSSTGAWLELARRLVDGRPAPVASLDAVETRLLSELPTGPAPWRRERAWLSISSAERTEKKMVCGTMPRSWRLAALEVGVRASGES